ncbi:MAG: DUF6265 family protein [Planctomycetota bacterium]
MSGSGSPSSPLQALAWIGGHWSNTQGEMRMEEYWMPPEGGLMLGLHRDIPEQGHAFFEYLRIEETADGIFYLATPQGGATTAFELIEVENRKALFENQGHDFPQRIRYWIDADLVLHARIEGLDKGIEQSHEWTYSRVP